MPPPPCPSHSPRAPRREQPSLRRPHPRAQKRFAPPYLHPVPSRADAGRPLARRRIIIDAVIADLIAIQPQPIPNNAAPSPLPHSFSPFRQLTPSLVLSHLPSSFQIHPPLTPHAWGAHDNSSISRNSTPLRIDITLQSVAPKTSAYAAHPTLNRTHRSVIASHWVTVVSPRLSPYRAAHYRHSPPASLAEAQGHVVQVLHRPHPSRPVRPTIQEGPQA